MDQNNSPDIYKSTNIQQKIVILLGDTNVGKTHLMNQYIYGTFPKKITSTIGVDTIGKTIKLQNGKQVKIRIWDTAGKECYRGITSSHYRKTDAVLVVYDITKEKTFESVPKWIEDIRYFAEPNIVIYLIGNKTDLEIDKNTMRKVMKDDANNLAQQNQIYFTEVSALTGDNINECFAQLLMEIYEVKNKLNDYEDNDLLLEENQQVNRRCAC